MEAVASQGGHCSNLSVSSVLVSVGTGGYGPEIPQELPITHSGE